MNEKTIKALESALYAVLYAALSKADSIYPLRDRVTTDYLMHRDAEALILAWFEQHVAGIRRLRAALWDLKKHLLSFDEDENEEFCDDWDLLLEFFGSPNTGWMTTISLAALPADIRQVLSNMTHIIEMAFDGEIQQCLDDLKLLAYSLSKTSADRELFKKKLSPGRLG